MTPLGTKRDKLPQQCQRPFNSSMSRRTYRPKTQGKVSPEKTGLFPVQSPVVKTGPEPKQRIGIKDLKQLKRELLAQGKQSKAEKKMIEHYYPM
jgi:hypothetical protein